MFYKHFLAELSIEPKSNLTAKLLQKLSSLQRLDVSMEEPKNDDVRHLVQFAKLEIRIEDLKGFLHGTYFDSNIPLFYLKMLRLVAMTNREIFEFNQRKHPNQDSSPPRSFDFYPKEEFLNP